MILILVSFSCTTYIHLRTPGGPHTPVWEMVLFVHFKKKWGEKGYFVIYAPTGLEPVAVAAPNGVIE